MNRENAMDQRDKYLVLLALRASFRGLVPSIADYQRGLAKIFNLVLCYGSVRNRLKKLEQLNLLESELVKGIVKNSLVDSKARVRLERFTLIYKRVYMPNQESRVLKEFVRNLASFSRIFMNKSLPKILCDDESLAKLK